MNALLTQFISEARDLLEQIGEGFLALEKQPNNAERINDVFRAVHTIKGASGLFEFQSITQVVHAAEDVLDAIRQDRLALDANLTDLLLDCFDLVESWFDSIEESESLPPNATETGINLAKKIRAVLPQNQQHAAANAAETNAASLNAETLHWLHNLPEKTRTDCAAMITAGEKLLAITYSPDEQCFFRGEDPLQLVRQITPLLALHIETAEPWSALAQLDYYRCVLRFRILTPAPRTDIEQLFRYVADQINLELLSTSEQLFPAAAHQNVKNSLPTISVEQEIFLQVLREQLIILKMDCTPENWEARLVSVQRIVSNSLNYLGQDAESDALNRAVQQAEATKSFAPLLELFTQWELAFAAAPQATAADEISTKQEISTLAGQDKPLKVAPAKIDQLMDLIGELVVAKNGLPYLAQRADKEYKAPELAREVKEQYAILHRIADSLYQSIMQVRMLPVSSIFQRFPRLVRDQSQKLHKQITLHLEGEETEADKNIIERLADPLIHLVRNSLDHGIEAPEERVAAGKDAVGTLKLNAFQESDRVIIEVIDDGRGIDPIKVKTKAYEKGVIDEFQFSTITDQEAQQLIFAPGFSTAEQITDLSGRGVGMDVVHRVVTASGGAIALESVNGLGTKIQISVPLTMAVSRILIVGAGHEFYGVPMDVVQETLRVPRQAFRLIKNEEVLVWRERMIPVRRLSQVLNFHTRLAQSTEQTEEAVLIIRQGNEDIGLVVDSFHERVDTILKPMDGLLTNCWGFSGTTILGDGRVLLILNFKELL